MTLQEFIAKYNGKKIDFDGFPKDNPYQCVDLMRYYLKEVWNKPQTPGVQGAYQIFNTLPTGYDKFTSGIPQAGDVITWNTNYGTNGHVAIVTTASGTKFQAFSQNDPLYSACKINTYSSYKNIIGWFRPTLMPIYPIEIKVKVVVNSPVPWASLEQKLADIATWYWVNSGGKLKLLFAYEYSNFTNIPFKVFPDGTAAIDDAWFDTNVLDKAYNNTTLIVKPEDLPSGYPGGYKLVGRTNGFFGKQPTKTVVACTESEISPTYPSVNNFVDLVRHELMHTCYFFSGSYIEHPGSETEYFGLDQTHKYFFLPSWLPPNTGLGQPEGAFNELNYVNIEQTLLTQPEGKPMLLYKFDDSLTQYVLADDATLIGVTGAGLPKVLKGRPEKIVVLPATQKANFVIADGVIN